MQLIRSHYSPIQTVKFHFKGERCLHTRSELKKKKERENKSANGKESFELGRATEWVMRLSKGTGAACTI